ncbi:hypothetical protein NEOKW01_0162 [Nematocida sp. AWRm80]|nr:hypothetical protein NEOKW01_0162 [Nematocida sp. AWRm80]
MARKKTKRVVKRAVKPKEENRFSCLECNREQSVTCKVDHITNTGYASCSLCKYTFQCSIMHLSQPIDVYSEWADTREAKNTPKPKENQSTHAPALEPESN